MIPYLWNSTYKFTDLQIEKHMKARQIVEKNARVAINKQTNK
jgi:hypothetical protein